MEQLKLIDSRVWLKDLSLKDRNYWQSRPDGEGWSVPCAHDTSKNHYILNIVLIAFAQAAEVH